MRHDHALPIGLCTVSKVSTEMVLVFRVCVCVCETPRASISTAHSAWIVRKICAGTVQCHTSNVMINSGLIVCSILYIFRSTRTHTHIDIATQIRAFPLIIDLIMGKTCNCQVVHRCIATHTLHGQSGTRERVVPLVYYYREWWADRFRQ